MALTPDNLKQPTQKDLQTITEIETYIDSYLEENYHAGTVTIYLHSQFDEDIFKARVVEGLERRYNMAGWWATFGMQHDRDGTLIFLKLEPRVKGAGCSGYD